MASRDTYTSSEVEPRGGGESAREEAEEQAEELRPEAEICPGAQRGERAGGRWQAEQVWSTTANDGRLHCRQLSLPGTTPTGRPSRSVPLISCGARATAAPHLAAPVHLLVQERGKRRTTPSSPSRRLPRPWLERRHHNRLCDDPRPRGDVEHPAGTGLSFSDKAVTRPTGPKALYIAWKASDCLASHNGPECAGQDHRRGRRCRAERTFSESAENQSATGRAEARAVFPFEAAANWTTTFLLTPAIKSYPGRLPSGLLDFFAYPSRGGWTGPWAS